MIYLILGLFGLYFLLILALLAGWTKALAQPSLSDKTASSVPAVSVIVPFRNEATNLETLIRSLLAQTYPVSEVIFVDDHSVDGSLSVVSKTVQDHSFMKVISSKGEGKKAALTAGIECASGEIIITTDADCIHPAGWITGMVEPFADDRTKLAFSAVKISAAAAPLQSLEFISVIATGVALSGMGTPSFCNGASMAFRKSVFLDVGGYDGNAHIPSGDDQFLLAKVVRQYPDGIRFINSPESIVTTSPQPSIRRFLSQRIRWAGKWNAGAGAPSKALAVFMFVFQFACLAAWVLVLSGTSARIAGFALMGKIIFDFVLLFNAGTFLGERVRLIPFLFLQIIYPFYVLFIGIGANFGRYSWKGRVQPANPKVPTQG